MTTCKNCGHELDEFIVIKNGTPQFPANYAHKYSPDFQTTCLEGGKVAIAGRGREKIYCGCEKPEPKSDAK